MHDELDEELNKIIEKITIAFKEQDDYYKEIIGTYQQAIDMYKRITEEYRNMIEEFLEK